ncbi:MAG: hypothetical protein AVDCRST_MAG88-2544, partial [uncultured Thermomicrobiales bacterium]
DTAGTDAQLAARKRAVRVARQAGRSAAAGAPQAFRREQGHEGGEGLAQRHPDPPSCPPGDHYLAARRLDDGDGARPSGRPLVRPPLSRGRGRLGPLRHRRYLPDRRRRAGRLGRYLRPPPARRHGARDAQRHLPGPLHRLAGAAVGGGRAPRRGAGAVGARFRHDRTQRRARRRAGLQPRRECSPPSLPQATEQVDRCPRFGRPARGQAGRGGGRARAGDAAPARGRDLRGAGVVYPRGRATLRGKDRGGAGPVPLARVLFRAARWAPGQWAGLGAIAHLRGARGERADLSAPELRGPGMAARAGPAPRAPGSHRTEQFL